MTFKTYCDLDANSLSAFWTINPTNIFISTKSAPFRAMEPFNGNIWRLVYAPLASGVGDRWNADHDYGSRSYHGLNVTLQEVSSDLPSYTVTIAIVNEHEQSIAKGAFKSDEEKTSVQFTSRNINDFLCADGFLRIHCTISLQTQFPDHNHLTSLALDMRGWMKSNFADITFEVKGEQVRASRFMISQRSPVFRSKLQSIWADKGTTEAIDIDDIEMDVFKMLLTYIHEARLSIDGIQFAIDLLLAAKKFEVSGLVPDCEEYIAQHIAPDNVVAILTNTRLLRSETIFRACIHDIKRSLERGIDYSDIPNWKEMYSDDLLLGKVLAEIDRS